MSREWTVLAALWIAGGVALWKWVPRQRLRETQAIFLFMQLLTWWIDLDYVQKGWVQNPVREFQYATESSFSLHFFVYPTIAVFFILFYPERRTWLAKGGWHLLGGAAISGLAFALERTTDLIEWKKWNLGWSLVASISFLFLVRLFHVWFRKGLRKT